MIMVKTKRPQIGLALGGGGSRGLAHLGVIKVLKENNIPIDFIAGSSIGAMVGGFYASGLTIEKMIEDALSTNWRKVFSVLFEPNLRYGLIGGNKVRRFIESYIGKKRFEECKIPFRSVATDLKTGEAIVFKTGEMASAIRASMAIPLIFKPEEINGKILGDGGLSMPIPVKIVKDMGAKIIIAVNLNKHYYDEKWKPKLYNIANYSLNILRHHLALSNLGDADIIIDVSITKDLSWYRFVNGRNKILAGEKAMEEKLPELNKIIFDKANNVL